MLARVLYALPMHTRHLLIAALTAVCPLAPAMADDGTPAVASPGPILLDTAAAFRDPQPSHPAPQPGGQSPGPSIDKPTHKPYGSAGSEWLSFGLGYANDFSSDQAAEVHAAYSRFLGDELEFCVELTGWYFDQTGDNAAGLNPSINFRWHCFHDEQFDWSIYGEVGIGVLLASDNVPDMGTGFDFTPRAGAGFTKALSSDGTRLQIGARWAHISNGRIEGDARNPGRDSLMIYAGIIIPF
jgi:hypothetical protein